MGTFGYIINEQMVSVQDGLSFFPLDKRMFYN